MVLPRVSYAREGSTVKRDEEISLLICGRDTAHEFDVRQRQFSASLSSSARCGPSPAI